MSKLYEMGIALAAIALFLVSGWGYGVYEYHRGWDALALHDRQLTATVKSDSVKVSTQVVTKFVPVVQTITTAGKTIVKKVPIYVTTHDDSRCVVGVGFVQLWNSANKMLLPSPPSSAYGEASPVVLSDIAAQHGREATIEQLNAAQLMALQDWVRQEQAVFANPSK